MKKLLIDVNSIVPFYVNGSVNGISRTTLELIQALSKVPDIPFEIILYSQNMKGIGCKNVDSSFKKIHFYLPNRNIIKKTADYFYLKNILTKYDLIHIPHNTDFTEDMSKSIFTIHDLIVYRYPKMWGLTNEERNYHQYLANKCKAIVTCSESSKKDIIHFWNINEDKVTVIPWGIDRNRFQPTYNAFYLKQQNINPDCYYFCASCNHPRKNLTLLLKAFNEYKKRKGIGQLVLLNPTKEELKPYELLIIEKEIIICRNINDEQLCLLYSQARASIIVSCFEGFGLPVLESLACDTAVLCAYNSSLIEAGSDVVDYFKELKTGCILDKLLEYDQLNKDQIINKGKIEKHLSAFTWEKCAQAYIQFYSKLLNT